MCFSILFCFVFKCDADETKCPVYAIQSGQVKIDQIPHKWNNSGFFLPASNIPFDV